MIETVGQWFNTDNFMPHGHCYLWRPGLLWTMVVANSVIALSYFSIPIALMVAMRKRKRDKMRWILAMFGAFIFACGATHLVTIYVIWEPNYYLDAGVKAVTAAVSLVTAIALWPLVGRAQAYVDNRELTTSVLIGNNAKLHESVSALQQQQYDFQSINKMSDYLQVCSNIEESSATIVQTLSRLWPESSGALYLISDEFGEFSLSGKWGEGEHGKVVQPNACWSYRLARPFPDDEDQTSLGCRAADCGVRQNKSCMPIIAGGETLGLVHIEGLDASKKARADKILPLLIERAGFAIYSIRLRQSLEFRSTRDSLTELFNRRYLDEALDVEIKRAERSGRQLSLVMFDLDHFKQLNDSHGHDAGDEALRVFARLLNDVLRAGDIACRYGGEEFALILPGADIEQAQEIAERVRAGLEEGTSGAYCDPCLADLTVSAGVANLEQHATDAASLLILADQALYQAKRSGRNRVVCAGANGATDRQLSAN